MERLRCPNCDNEVYFDSMRCVRCDTALTVLVDRGGGLRAGDAEVTGSCARRDQWRCNWSPAPGGELCASCVITDPGGHAESPLLVPFLTAQRRALWQLVDLGVTPAAGADDGTSSGPPLRFEYRSRHAGEAVTIGHLGGTITLDLDEADPARGEQVRETLNERYRTPLGHIRHETGHYVWLTSVAGQPDQLARFRDAFGDETADYQAALDAHYGRVDDGTWREEHVSFYASAHPWEDFAESWAQVMHVHDVVSTGAAWSVISAPSAEFRPAEWVSLAVTASLAANELARSMGMRDLYPFALSSGARRRIEQAWLLVAPHGPLLAR